MSSKYFLEKAGLRTLNEMIASQTALIQSLTIAIVFELIYYTNGHPRA